MVQVEKLSKSYQKKTVLREISLEAKPGEMVALIGENGSGKSTLMRILSGIERADSGSITYFGQKMTKNGKVFAQYCGYVPQENGLLEELSVQDNLSLWTGKRGKPQKQLLELFRLEEVLPVPVSQLSGGMKRRVAAACAMALFPPILLMDEPTSALDRSGRTAIHDFMKEYLNQNGILIVATHEEAEIAMANQVMLLEGGVNIPQKKE